MHHRSRKKKRKKKIIGRDYTKSLRYPGVDRSLELRLGSSKVTVLEVDGCSSTSEGGSVVKGSSGTSPSSSEDERSSSGGIGMSGFSIVTADSSAVSLGKLSSP